MWLVFNQIKYLEIVNIFNLQAVWRFLGFNFRGKNYWIIADTKFFF